MLSIMEKDKFSSEDIRTETEVKDIIQKVVEAKITEWAQRDRNE